MLRVVLHLCIALVLLVVTQVGVIAWLLSLVFRRRLVAFSVLYVLVSVATLWVAPLFGRVALDCFSDGPLRVQSPLYCALNRTYVAPALRDALVDTAAGMERRFPGTQTLVLDANFPFFDGFPLIPHLSHDDGEKADLAFYYRDAQGYLPGATRSPIGYFAFEDGPTECAPRWPGLRWDFAALQPLWHDYALDEARMAAVLRILAADPRIGRMFIEPHLVARLGVSHPDIRFQGCRAARHDDHIHLQLR